MNEETNNKKKLIPDIITPNRLTYLRVLMIPVFVAFFFLEVIPYNYAISAAVFAIAALTDLADGYIARKYNLVSNMGKFLDPIADKVLVSTALILLLSKPGLFNAAVYGNGVPETQIGYIIAVICVCVIMARELIISGFRQVAATTGLVLAAEKLGKYKTTFQDIAIVLLLVALSVCESSYSVGLVLVRIGAAVFVIATGLTVASGVSYIVKNKEVLKN